MRVGYRSGAEPKLAHCSNVWHDPRRGPPSLTTWVLHRFVAQVGFEPTVYSGYEPDERPGCSTARHEGRLGRAEPHNGPPPPPPSRDRTTRGGLGSWSPLESSCLFRKLSLPERLLFTQDLLPEEGRESFRSLGVGPSKLGQVQIERVADLDQLLSARQAMPVSQTRHGGVVIPRLRRELRVGHLCHVSIIAYLRARRARSAAPTLAAPRPGQRFPG